MGFIRNNNVWKINKILAGISSGGVTPEDVQDMIDTSIAPIETAIEGKQNVLTAGDGITIDNDVISVINNDDWELFTGDRTELVTDGLINKDIKMIYYGNNNQIEGIGYISKGCANIQGYSTTFNLITYFSNNGYATSSFNTTSGNAIIAIYNISASGSGVTSQLIYNINEYNYTYYRDGITGRNVKVYVRG